MVSMPLTSVTSRSFSSTPGNSAVSSIASLLSATSIFGDSRSELNRANGLRCEKSSNVFWTSRNSDPNGSSPRPKNEGKYGLAMVTSFNWDIGWGHPVVTTDFGLGSRVVTAGCGLILDRNWGTKNSHFDGRGSCARATPAG